MHTPRLCIHCIYDYQIHQSCTLKATIDFWPRTLIDCILWLNAWIACQPFSVIYCVFQTLYINCILQSQQSYTPIVYFDRIFWDYMGFWLRMIISCDRKVLARTLTLLSNINYHSNQPIYMDGLLWCCLWSSMLLGIPVEIVITVLYLGTPLSEGSGVWDFETPHISSNYLLYSTQR